MKKVRYSEEEIKIIKEEVKKSPHNISEALRTAAEKINRSHFALRDKYYRDIQKTENNKLFILASPKKLTKNYKNIVKNNKELKKNTPSKFKRILAILFE